MVKESNKSYVQRTLQDLIDSSKEAVAILIGISKLETQITEGDFKEEKDFEKGLAEKFAKR